MITESKGKRNKGMSFSAITLTKKEERPIMRVSPSSVTIIKRTINKGRPN
jgi:hypothetical protein